MRADQLQPGDLLKRPGGTVLVRSIHHRHHRLWGLPKVVVIWSEPETPWSTARLDMPAGLEVQTEAKKTESSG